MDSKILSSAKNKLAKYLKDRDILDIVLFGSSVKGKASPEDIDIAVISKKEVSLNIQDFHVSILKPEDFFVNPPTIINTLLREGYSLKNNKPFSEIYKFLSRCLFVYNLSGLNPSLKVKIVNMLRGKRKNLGLVCENGGEWLANQVFLVPVGKENIFERVFVNFKIKFKKSYILIH